MEEKETEYRNMIQQLIVEISDAISFWILFSKLREIQFVKDYSKSFSFIQAIKNSCSAAFMIQLSKLIDSKGVSISLATKFLKKYPCLFEKTKNDTMQVVERIDQTLHKHQILIKNLTNQRNKFHVHIDVVDIKESSYKVFKEFRIELNEIDPFLKDLCEALGILVNHYRNKEGIPFMNFLDEETIFQFLSDKYLVEQQLNIDQVFLKLKN